MGFVLEPKSWVFDDKQFSETELRALYPKNVERWQLRKFADESPDGTRTFYSENEGRHEQVIRDLKTQKVLFDFTGMWYMPYDFIDDNTVLLIWLDLDNDNESQYLFMRRHHLEWWWGIFYRPLFWIAMVVFFGTVFEFVSMRKRLKTA